MTDIILLVNWLWLPNWPFDKTSMIYYDLLLHLGKGIFDVLDSSNHQ